MNNTQFFIYLAILVISTYLIRAIPFAAVERKIENPFIKSFLTYIPYAVLTVMTLPGIFFVTSSKLSALIGFVVAVLVALKWKNLTLVATCACVSVYVAELFLCSF